MSCDLCKLADFKYSCPRCNAKYCSLDCYRSPNHSQCSEAFYKECVINELQANQSVSDNKKKVLDMLDRLENENDPEWEDIDSDDESDENDLAGRLAEVDLDNPDAIWERLTADEREEFKSIVYNGEIEKIVQQIEPWWKQHELVTDIQENEKRIKEISENCPQVLESIKDFSKISAKPPAKCVIFNIANVIAAYTFIYRLYNGDHFNYVLEAASNFIKICDNIKLNANFEDVPSVVDTVIQNCHNSNLFADVSTKSLILEDLRDIFNGLGDLHNFYLLSAMSDIVNLLEAAKVKAKQRKKLKSSAKGRGFSKEFANYENVESFPELQNQTHLTGCIKKLEFYLSFLKHRYNKTEWQIEV